MGPGDSQTTMVLGDSPDLERGAEGFRDGISALLEKPLKGDGHSSGIASRGRALSVIKTGTIERCIAPPLTPDSEATKKAIKPNEAGDDQEGIRTLIRKVEYNEGDLKYSAYLVRDIAEETMLVYSAAAGNTLPLNEAHAAEVRALAKKMNWNEILEPDNFRLSTQGPQSILIAHREGQAPQLVSTALIRPVPPKSDPANILSRTPLFRSNEFQLMTPPTDVRNKLLKYKQQLAVREITLDLHPEALDGDFSGTAEFEDAMDRAIPGLQSEILRVTAAGSAEGDLAALKSLFYGLRAHTELQCKDGMFVSYGITTADLLDMLEVVEKLSELACYIPISKIRFPNNDYDTIKIRLLNGNIAEALGKINFRVFLAAILRAQRSKALPSES